MSGPFSIIDLFSGAGGLSEGFCNKSYRFIAHVEKNAYASDTLETRMIYHVIKKKDPSIYFDYLKGIISREELKQFFIDNYDVTSLIIRDEIARTNRCDLINLIKEQNSEYNANDVDVIIGGPPCQAYSTIGRGRLPKEMQSDPRNYLFKHYLTFLKVFQPKMFVFENVPGITSAKNGEIFQNLQSSFASHGYLCEAKILNAADFGVLQERKRIIIIGWKMEYDFQYPEFKKDGRADECINNLFIDLPLLKVGEGKTPVVKEYLSPPTKYHKESGIRTDNDILIQHEARFHNERDLEIYRLAVEKWESDEIRIKYNELPEHLITHNNRVSFLDRFKVVNGKGYSHSIVSHLGKDGHYFIHPDINQNRSITVREAARIQSFPDNYKFEGCRKSQYMQIGNAVPPLMSIEIATKLIEKLKTDS